MFPLRLLAEELGCFDVEGKRRPFDNLFTILPGVGTSPTLHVLCLALGSGC